MIQSLKSTAFSVFGASALTLGFTAMPSFALSTTLGIPSQDRTIPANGGVGFNPGGIIAVNPIDPAQNFSTTESYSIIPAGPTFTNPNYVLIGAFGSTTSGLFDPSTIFGLTSLSVNFDYSLSNTVSSFGIFDVTTSLLTFASLLAPSVGGNVQDIGSIGVPLAALTGGTKRFQFSTSQDTLRFSNFNFTADTTPVPFEFNPALGLVLTGALFGGSKLLKKAKKSTKVG